MNVRSVFFPPALLLETLLIVTFPLMGAQGTDLQLHGEIKSQTWVSVNEGEVQANANSLSLKLSYSGENYRFYAEPELLSRGLTEADQIDELEDTQHIFNLSYDLREAYVDLYNFILPVLDIRIGKQIIVWGTGDAINPTNPLSPRGQSEDRSRVVSHNGKGHEPPCAARRAGFSLFQCEGELLI